MNTMLKVGAWAVGVVCCFSVILLPFGVIILQLNAIMSLLEDKK